MLEARFSTNETLNAELILQNTLEADIGSTTTLDVEPVNMKAERVSGGVKLTIKDVLGTTTATIADGAKGDKGDKGDPGQGASSWSDLTNKPFNTINEEAFTVTSGVLSVKTTEDAEEDNSLPITSSGVNTIVGNIDLLLSLI